MFPHDAESILRQPVSELDPSRRSLVASALVSSIPELPADAVEAGFTWSDVAAWLSAADELRQPASVRVKLRVATADDLGHLYRAATDPARSFAWRFRGSTLGFEAFARSFDDGVLAQFAVVDCAAEQLQGLVTSYNLDASNGHAYFGYLRSLDAHVSGALTEALGIFIAHLFANFPLRALYCEVPAFNKILVDGFAETGLLEQVARFPDHLFSQDSFQDLFVYRITRESFYERFRSWNFGNA